MTSKEKEKDRRLYKTYGITLQEWEEMMNAQGRVCMICEMVPGTGRLCVDHVHIKGFKGMKPENKKKYVRGILCFMCNVAVGKFERTNNGALNRKRVEGLIRYFKKFKLKGEIE